MNVPSRASRLIDERIRTLGDWRGAALSRMRTLILRAAPTMTEEWQSDGPAWACDGVVCTGEVHAKVVKLVFTRGADVPDRTGLFEPDIAGEMTRSIDVREGETIDATAFERLIKVAIVVNGAATLPNRSTKMLARPTKQLSDRDAGLEEKDGDAPVQAYIAAMVGWKRGVGQKLDALIERTVPGVTKGVRWNSPFYGADGHGWFLGIHVFSRYVKVNFFRGNSLDPVPPGSTPTSADTRWIDLREGEFDEVQMTAWVKQAAALPGWNP